MAEWLQRAVFDATFWGVVTGLCTYWALVLIDSIVSDVRLARRLRRERAELLEEPEMPTLLELREWHVHRMTMNDEAMPGDKRVHVCLCVRCEAVRIRLGMKPVKDWRMKGLPRHVTR